MIFSRVQFLQCCFQQPSGIVVSHTGKGRRGAQPRLLARLVIVDEVGAFHEEILDFDIACARSERHDRTQACDAAADDPCLFTRLAQRGLLGRLPFFDVPFGEDPVLWRTSRPHQQNPMAVVVLAVDDGARLRDDERALRFAALLSSELEARLHPARRVLVHDRSVTVEAFACHTPMTFTMTRFFLCPSNSA